jgi:serine phosphatase RsbU (regulator of sigma subunit)
VGLGSGTPSFGHKSIEPVGGERLLLFTDGVIELPTPSGRPLGLRAVVKMFEATRKDSLEEARLRLAEAVDRARGESTQDDDITFVLVELPAPVGRG